MTNPFTSQSERDIRAAVVSRARAIWPDARIIHELNVEQGIVRADVAAVTADRLVLFEIKSERDKLHRLSNQLRHFAPVCHHLIVAAHEKWCQRSTIPNACIHTIIDYAGVGYLWRFPASAPWQAPAIPAVPWPHRMLKLLWADELRAIARDQKFARVQTATAGELARSLALHMTGREIEKSVCAALRQRQFAEADPPIERALA